MLNQNNCVLICLFQFILEDLADDRRKQENVCNSFMCVCVFFLEIEIKNSIKKNLFVRDNETYDDIKIEIIAD